MFVFNWNFNATQKPVFPSSLLYLFYTMAILNLCAILKVLSPIFSLSISICQKKKNRNHQLGTPSFSPNKRQNSLFNSKSFFSPLLLPQQCTLFHPRALDPIPSCCSENLILAIASFLFPLSRFFSFLLLFYSFLLLLCFPVPLPPPLPPLLFFPSTFKTKSLSS